MKQYPVNLNIDYPEKSNKLTALIRLVLIIPIVIILALISSYAEALSLAVALMILFREKYPKWWFDWNLALSKFWLRIAAYGLLIRDEYPSTEDDQAIQVEIPYPDVKNDLNRWMPLVKWILAIPHLIALLFIFIAVVFCSVFAWFAILFTGKYPKVIFDFVEGFLRWSLRVNAYVFLLTTDEYPPFRLREESQVKSSKVK
ncbi:MAG TPA: DUF4389 domain-containing protein [Candidatus Thioglobus sp.]|nr:DUF4389 domain-containing protein [Candidatus Thioglobus sp.]